MLYAVDDLGRRSAGDGVRVQSFANQPPVADAGPDDTRVAAGGSVSYTP